MQLTAVATSTFRKAAFLILNTKKKYYYDSMTVVNQSESKEFLKIMTQIASEYEKNHQSLDWHWTGGYFQIPEVN